MHNHNVVDNTVFKLEVSNIPLQSISTTVQPTEQQQQQLCKSHDVTNLGLCNKYILVMQKASIRVIYYCDRM